MCVKPVTTQHTLLLSRASILNRRRIARNTAVPAWVASSRPPLEMAMEGHDSLGRVGRLMLRVLGTMQYMCM